MLQPLRGSSSLAFALAATLTALALCAAGCNLPNPLAGWTSGKAKRSSTAPARADAYHKDKFGKNLSEEERTRLLGARMHNRAGMDAYGQKQYAAAAERFRQALRLVPDYIDAMNNLGRTLYAGGQFTAALDAYGKALATAAELEPDNALVLASIHANVGDVYRQLEQYDRAVEHYEEVLALTPDLPRAQYAMGNLRLKQGRTRDACWHFARTLELDPHFDKALLGRAIANNLLENHIDAWKDIMRLEERGYEVNPSLRETIVRGVEEARRQARFRPGT